MTPNLPIRVNKKNAPMPPFVHPGGNCQWTMVGHRHELKKIRSVEPSKIEETLRPYLDQLGVTGDITIEHFKSGGFNDLFCVNTTSANLKELLLRTNGNEIPWYKVESEVATMEFVRKNTTIPVPVIYAYDSSIDNPVGSPWFLVEKIRANTYAGMASSLSNNQKRAIGAQVAHWVYELRQLTFTKIGSLYFGDEGFEIRELVDNKLWRDWRGEYKARRGPYSNLQQYCRALCKLNEKEVNDKRVHLRASLAGVREDMQTSLQIFGYDGMDDFEHNENISPRKRKRQAMLDFKTTCIDWDASPYSVSDLKQADKAISKLRRQLPNILPKSDLRTNPATLHHMDISSVNTLVDASGRAVALIDWERAHTMPVEWTTEAVPWIIEPKGNCYGTFPRSGKLNPLQEGFYDEVQRLIPDYLDIINSEETVRGRKLRGVIYGEFGPPSLELVKQHVGSATDSASSSPVE